MNDGEHCTVPIPQYSELEARRGWFDFQSLAPQCEEIDFIYQHYTLPEHLRNKTDLKTLGFQRIENYSNAQRIDNNILMASVRNDVIDMDDPDVPQEIKDSIEFTLNMTDPLKNELNVTLKRNETRAQEQMKLRKKILAKDKAQGNKDRIDKDVFILYIDNLSRANFKRKLPKVSKWLNQFVNSDDDDLELFQFFRYHSVFYNTINNNDALWYGQVGAVEDMSQNVFDEFGRNGYITGLFKDGCETHVNTFVNESQTLPHWDHLACHIG